MLYRVLPLFMLIGLVGCNGQALNGGRVATATLDAGVWLKGDLHLHSHHSEDAADNQLAEIIAEAESRGMDFFVATDHDNHVNGDVAGNTWADPDYRSDSMIMLYGAEWTTDIGHGNTFATAPYDHQRFFEVRNRDSALVGERARELGIHFSANHPTNGDAWSYSYDAVDSVEVWNALWLFPSPNTDNLTIWDDLLKAGHRIAGRGGSDCHHQQGIEPLGLNVGTPTTWVFARERTAKAMLEALKAGRASISYAPSGPRVELRADLDGDKQMDLMMGDAATAAGQDVTFDVSLHGNSALSQNAKVRVIKNGAELTSLRLANGRAQFSDAPSATERSYYRVEVEGLTLPGAETPLGAVLYGRMLALSNPIYFNF